MKPQARHDPLLGSILEGRYRLMSLLGRGGMGSVYVAEETRLGRRYALKLLKPEFAEDRAQVERFLREAQTIARLEHPNIVDIHSFGEDPSGFVFFTMELLAGEDLESRLTARIERPYSVREVCMWAIQIARAVGVVHQNGLIHRDLKTQNVFLARTRDGGEIVKLLDFGIARPEQGSELTATGLVLGTPKYMSPEQVRNEPLDRRSDIYSFGVLLFKMLTGRSPFGGEALQVAMQHLTSTAPSPSSLAPAAGIPPQLDELVLKAMAKQRDDRHASMEEIEQKLVRLLATEGISLPGLALAEAGLDGTRKAVGPPAAAASSSASAPRPDGERAHEEELSLSTTASMPRPRIPAESLETPGLAPISPSKPSPAASEGALDEATAQNLLSAIATEPALAPVRIAPVQGEHSLGRTRQIWPLIVQGASLAGFFALAIWLVTPGNATPGTTTQANPDRTSPPPTASTTAQLSPRAPELPKHSPPFTAAEPVAAETEPSPPVPSPLEPENSVDPGAAEGEQATREELLKAKPKRGAGTRKQVPAPTTPKAESTAQADPIAGIKERSRACRKQHNAVGQPQLTIEYVVGSDGTVLRATPSSDTPLGACLANAVKQARFEPKIRLRQELSL
ncbi:serine/threonine-protein kinase [Nannocystis punicea]|uniref:Protein kinase n=1 Tax=Nannocystis punicea TaxID=2995304 RepID=A0ABY7HBE7_9BACT|nr:serine/threonine-protein kinase [Nannocystis poenicansa]WAS96598.1 protein kinase [Nannocystis poenicansa]